MINKILISILINIPIFAALFAFDISLAPIYPPTLTLVEFAIPNAKQMIKPNKLLIMTVTEIDICGDATYPANKIAISCKIHSNAFWNNPGKAKKIYSLTFDGLQTIDIGNGLKMCP